MPTLYMSRATTHSDRGISRTRAPDPPRYAHIVLSNVRYKQIIRFGSRDFKKKNASELRPSRYPWRYLAPAPVLV